MEVIEIKEIYSKNKSEFLYYIGSDDHYGGEDFDMPSWKRYHNEAADRNAIIFKIGDQIGAIVPGDPRFTFETLIPELRVDNMINVLQDKQFEMWKPYADHIGGMGIGNHEAMFIKYHKINPLLPVIEKLNNVRSKKLKPIAYLDYCGFIRITYENKAGGGRRPYIIAYHHGVGGNAPVTLGIVKAQHMVSGLENTDLLAIGHVHKNLSIRAPNRLYLSKRGKIMNKEMRIVITGTHQRSLKETGNSNLKWSEAMGYFAAPFGGIFLKNKIVYVDDKPVIDTRIEH